MTAEALEALELFVEQLEAELYGRWREVWDKDERDMIWHKAHALDAIKEEIERARRDATKQDS